VKATNKVNLVTYFCLSVLSLAVVWCEKQALVKGYSFSTNSSSFEIVADKTWRSSGNCLLPNAFCLSQLPVTTHQPPVNPKLVAANTRFGLKLLSQLNKQQTNQNILISPASIAVCLSIAYNGANGETREEIARTLEFQEISLQEVNQANAVFKNALQDIDPKIQLSLANSLWLNKNENIASDFQQKIQEFYQTEIKNINFASPSATSTINNWVKQSTNGKIDTIVEKIEPNSVFLLVNAIYFLGAWKHPFPQELTKDYSFTLGNNTQKPVKMMFQEIYGVKYLENQLFQAISLPYGNGRLSMYIFLPNQKVGLRGFYQNLNPPNWEKWMQEFAELEMDYSQKISLGLPRFKSNYEIDLKDTLKALGMEVAFSKNADFSAMMPGPLWIDKVQHKTYLEVNEAGTEAAAVTAVGGTRGGEIKMIVNRPFFSAIRDNQTGTILFMGSIVDPN